MRYIIYIYFINIVLKFALTNLSFNKIIVGNKQLGEIRFVKIRDYRADYP